MNPPIEFEVIAKDGDARAGILKTRRGDIETPVFMPVGTAGAVKGTRLEVLESDDLDARIILGNTYHLWLRPGAQTIQNCGGLHRFMGWNRALLTDSGGFQVWSLGALRKISEEGTEFRSHVDGSPRFLAEHVDARGIAKPISQIRQHRLEDARIDRRRCTVIEVNFTHRWNTALGLALA